MGYGESQTIVVVASDPGAYSDVHGAVTLVRVLDTSCLGDAGGCDEPMPTASRALLEGATKEVWVVGDDEVLDLRVAGAIW